MVSRQALIGLLLLALSFCFVKADTSDFRHPHLKPPSTASTEDKGPGDDATQSQSWQTVIGVGGSFTVEMPGIPRYSTKQMLPAFGGIVACEESDHSALHRTQIACEQACAIIAGLNSFGVLRICQMHCACGAPRN
jgi:hypothetical protein